MRKMNNGTITVSYGYVELFNARTSSRSVEYIANIAYTVDISYCYNLTIDRHYRLLL